VDVHRIDPDGRVLPAPQLAVRHPVAFISEHAESICYYRSVVNYEMLFHYIFCGQIDGRQLRGLP
jgi:hypothetical protein